MIFRVQNYCCQSLGTTIFGSHSGKVVYRSSLYRRAGRHTKLTFQWAKKVKIRGFRYSGQGMAPTYRVNCRHATFKVYITDHQSPIVSWLPPTCGFGHLLNIQHVRHKTTEFHSMSVSAGVDRAHLLLTQSNSYSRGMLGLIEWGCRALWFKNGSCLEAARLPLHMQLTATCSSHIQSFSIWSGVEQATSTSASLQQ